MPTKEELEDLEEDIESVEEEEENLDESSQPSTSESKPPQEEAVEESSSEQPYSSGYDPIRSDLPKADVDMDVGSTEDIDKDLQDVDNTFSQEPESPEEPQQPPSEEEPQEDKGAWDYETEREKEAGYPVEEKKEEETSPYSEMSKRFIQRTPEGEVEHPEEEEEETYETPGLEKIPEIVEESYQELVEEKTKPEFTFETMPERLYSQGGLVFWRPTEFYYWYLFTKRQFEERGIPYTEEELRKFARERHKAYMMFRDFEEVLKEVDQTKLEGIDVESIRREFEKFLFSPPAFILTRKELHEKAMSKLIELEKDLEKYLSPQELPGVMASLHSELEYALEKYFPTPEIPEDTLAGKGIAWTKGLPPVIREAAQFGVGIFGPLEEYREMGNYLGIQQPNVPTMLGGMISGMVTGSTEEIRMVEKYPAYAVGTLVGEVVWDYLLGKAAAKGISKFFGWIESKVPKTPEGKWIVKHYPPVTRNVLKFLEKTKKFLVHEKKVAEVLEDVKGRGVFFMDLDEGIRGATKSFIRVSKKELDDLADASRLLGKGDILVGEYKEARGFLSKAGDVKFAARSLEKFEMPEIGDIVEFTRRLKEIGADEGIMFRFVDEEGVRVPSIIEVHPGKKGIKVTAFTPTALFEDELPLKYLEEGMEAFKYEFKPRGIKFKPEEDFFDIKPPSEDAGFDEWYKYWTKRLEIGKKKYGLGKPSAVEDVDEVLKRFMDQLEEGKKKYGLGGRGEGLPEGYSATILSSDSQQLIQFIRNASRGSEGVDITNILLGVTTETKPVDIVIPKITPSLLSKPSVSLIDVELPRIDLSLEGEEKISVVSRTKPIIFISEEKEGRRMTFKPTIPSRTPEITFPYELDFPNISWFEEELPFETPKQTTPLVPKVTPDLSPPPPTGKGKEDLAPPIPPILLPPGGGYIGGRQRSGLWRKWVSTWFGGIEDFLIGKKRQSYRRKKHKRRRKKK